MPSTFLLATFCTDVRPCCKMNYELTQTFLSLFSLLYGSYPISHISQNSRTGDISEEEAKIFLPHNNNEKEFKPKFAHHNALLGIQQSSDSFFYLPGLVNAKYSCTTIWQICKILSL
jgi:hypothetical protein